MKRICRICAINACQRIQEPKRKNVLINYDKLKGLISLDTYDSVKASHKKWIESCFQNGTNNRYEKWAKSIAVGSKSFIRNVKLLMGATAMGLKCIEAGRSFKLRETQIPDNDDFGVKKSDIESDNAYDCN